MHFRKLGGLILASLFLFQISQVYSFVLYTDGAELYKVIPNKTYKGEVCIGKLQPNFYYVFEPDINYKVINNFTISEVFWNENNLIRLSLLPMNISMIIQQFHLISPYQKLSHWMNQNRSH